MNPRIKFLIGGLFVLSSSGYLMYSATKQTGMYYFFPSELAAKVAADPTFRNVGVKMGARVVPGSIVRDPSGREVRFVAADSLKSYPIVYRGIAPDTFTDSADVVVEGRLDETGTFQATVLLAKCASRMESAPENPNKSKFDYKDAPGYRPAPAQRGS